MATSKRRRPKKPPNGKPARGVTARFASTQPAGRALGPLRDKVAVITGASRGIGLAIAESFADAGCNVVLAARKSSSLRSAVEKVTSVAPISVMAKTCDVADPKQVSALFTAVKQRFPRVDILVNNAGMAHPLAPVPELSLETWNEVINANLTGMFLCSRAAIPLMQPGGVIVNVLSVAATDVFTGMAAYCASKWGALGLTNTMREELREKGIRVLALVPGPTDTKIWDQFWPDAPHEKMMRPEEIAQAVLTAVTMPAGTSVEEIRMGPASGTL